MEERFFAFRRWCQRLRSHWVVVLFALLAVGLFLLGVFGAELEVRSQGGILGSTVGIVLVGGAGVVAATT